jgi:hypothetical protein
MSTTERRRAARANQRAAAFIRFQLMGDHEAMHLVLLGAGAEDETSRLGFVTALASIAGSLATQVYGREQALDRMRVIAETSAALSAADDIEGFFQTG